MASKKSGEVLYRKGDQCTQSVHVIINGNIINGAGEVLRIKEEVFGSEYILRDKKSKRFNDDIIVGEDSVLGEIPIHKIREIIGGDIE